MRPRITFQTNRSPEFKEFTDSSEICSYFFIVADNNNQIVYVLTNPAMPGLIKIGMTTRSELDKRMKELYGSGVPVPFECAFACQVQDAHEVEKALHFAFGDNRINPNREFFKLDPVRVRAVLMLLKVDDVTIEIDKQIESEVTPVDKQSSKKLRRPKMNFHEIGIPTGSVLNFKEGEYQVKVVDEKKVEFDKDICSLTAATRKILHLPEDYPLQPSPYWSFNGKPLKEIYEEYHNSLEE